MKKQFLFSTAILLLLLSTKLTATSIQGDQNITITSEVSEDLYLAGNNILIDAPIRGDLVCAGGNVTIQDTITEDVLLCGGTIKVMGYIGDDLRVAGGTISILNNINGDLLIAGGEVTVGKDVIINGDLHMVGGKLTMNGTVLGSANLRGGELVWNGIAENGLAVKAGDLFFNGTVKGKSQLAAQDIELGSDAQFYGEVAYWNSEGHLDFDGALLNGANATYDADLSVYDSDFNWRYLGIGLVAFWLYRLLTAALIIALLIWMFHHFFFRNSPENSRNYASHLGYGILYIIGLPVLITLAFATVIGIPVGLVLMMLYGLTIALGHILAALLIAYGLDAFYEKNWNRRMLFLVAICSYLALKIVGVIPLLGIVVSFLVAATAFGTILYIWRKTRFSKTYTTVE